MSARDAIVAAGGLCSISDLARRWGISRQRALQLSRHPAFPEPVYRSTSTNRVWALWLADEVDAFRNSNSNR